MRSLLLTIVGLSVFVGDLFAQGCSDAGFCTMGAMRPAQVYNKKINFKLRALSVEYYHGNTTLSPDIKALTTDFTFGINEKTSVQVKLPYMWIDGNLGSNNGLGDISLSLTSNLYSSENFHFNATIGAKIPTNDSNINGESDVSDAPMPMYYQTSLGSYDFIAGGAFTSRKWMFATGIQIALTENANDFRYEEWDGYPSQGYLIRHDLANNLKRGTDVMLRVERAFLFSKFDFRVGMLPIFRITQDEILNTNTNEREKLDGTTGMALSAITGAAYHFSTKSSLKLTYGVKITDREVNPDGLTRDWVFSIAHVLTF